MQQSTTWNDKFKKEKKQINCNVPEFHDIHMYEGPLPSQLLFLAWNTWPNLSMKGKHVVGWETGTQSQTPGHTFQIDKLLHLQSSGTAI